MHHVSRLLLSLCLLLPAGAQEPAAPVPAVLHQGRDGLGNFFAKVQSGLPVKVAYLGGSITAADGWRVKSRQWLAGRFPQANIEEIHAAIGGTGSDLGVYRVEKDALRFAPDLLFVEFAVNDGGAKPENIWRGMEGIVRQTWAKLPACDICFVYTFKVGYEADLREGRCPAAAAADERVAEFYGIPSINFALKVVQEETAGTLVFQVDKGKEAPEGQLVFSNDGVHPLDAGHAIYASVLAEAFEAWIPGAKPLDHSAKLGKTLIPDHWQAAQIIEPRAEMFVGGWTKLSADQGLGKDFGKRLGAIWEGTEPGQKMTFRFKGSAVALYDLLAPDGGQVIVSVDGVTRAKPVARFDSYCTYTRIATLWIAQDLDADKVHEITVEIHPEQPDRQPVAFRLKHPEEELKAPKFQGTKVRVGGILVLGEIAP